MIEGDHIVLPGIGTAHSHAFQRALRGRVQRRQEVPGSFWSWRGLMYELAEKLDPESIYAISRFAFMELALSGVTAVGEFHYVHHDRGGAPYADRTCMSDAVIRAARDVGLRITLLRVVYERAGHDKELEPTQRRFVDRSLDDALDDIDALTKRWASDPCVKIGVAPHSVRAVRRESIVSLHAALPNIPFHMHVAEQRREVDECMAEHNGRRVVEMLGENGIIDERFTAVHATYLDRYEPSWLKDSFVCICRTTERDLGDGLPDMRELRFMDVRLCTGTDSHASSDPFEEARAIELDERTRYEKRVAAYEAPALLDALTTHAYASIGQENTDRVELDLDDPSLAGIAEETAADSVIFGASPRAVKNTFVAGYPVVVAGKHPLYREVLAAYRTALRTLL